MLTTDIEYCNERLRTGALRNENGLLVPVNRLPWGSVDHSQFVQNAAAMRVNLALLEGTARITTTPILRVVLMREEDNDATVKVENYCVTGADLHNALAWVNGALELNILARSALLLKPCKDVLLADLSKEQLRLVNRELNAGNFVFDISGRVPRVVAEPAKDRELPKIGAAVHYWPADDDQYLLKSMGPFAAIVVYVKGLQVHLHVMASPVQTRLGTDPSKLQFFRKCQWGTPSVEWIS